MLMTCDRINTKKEKTKPERLHSRSIYFENTFVTSIYHPSDWGLKNPSDSYLACSWQPTWKNLLLHAQSGYFRIFILKWLKQKPDLGNCD